MIAKPWATINRVLLQDLSNAKDNLNRHKLQQKRMPFDHDNNNALDSCEAWVKNTVRAIAYAEAIGGSLDEVIELLEGYVDVKDSEGGPVANNAMRAVQILEGLK